MSAKDPLQQRLDFMDFDAEARATLRDLKPLIEKALPPALAAFYEGDILVDKPNARYSITANFWNWRLLWQTGI
jgi:hypothetical protein